MKSILPLRAHYLSLQSFNNLREILKNIRLTHEPKDILFLSRGVHNLALIDTFWRKSSSAKLYQYLSHETVEARGHMFSRFYICENV